MTNFSEIIIYICFISWGVYGILIVPYFGAKIMQKTGESELFWFFVLVLLNLWALLFILFRPCFREGLSKSDIRKLIILSSGYIVLFALIIFILYEM